MSSAKVIAPASMGNQKVPMRAKLRAVTDNTANVVIQGMGFIVGDDDGFPLSEGGVLTR